MGIDKSPYSNTMEATAKVMNGAGILKNIPEAEFAEMFKSGCATQLQIIESENH